MNAFTELHGWMHRVFRSGESITPAIRLVWEHLSVWEHSNCAEALVRLARGLNGADGSVLERMICG
ncbi:hypothetical protein, partial [Xanthomonas hortorum]|uniref:hypothetical protein n=1 Tax=Xanthomonas hortorum TaxID=56454 RepID=UPI001E3F7428